MCESDDEMYADNLSDVSDQESDISDEENRSEIIVRNFTNLLRPVIGSSDEDENSSVEEEVEWSRQDSVVITQDCMEDSGVQISIDDWNIRSAVELFFGDDLMKLLVTETNRYHEQQENYTEANKNKKWTDTNIDEMKKFLALIILMGLGKKRERDEYWSTDPLMSTSIFGKIMSRNRFREIWRYWHFSNNENCRDRLDKIKPVTTYFQNKFQTVYKPVKELSLDEAIMPWRGRLSFCTYNPDKIVKYGILIRTVCEARSGYICNFEIYCAKGIKLQETIISVLSPYHYFWHEVYMDNYYNSLTVTEELLKRKTNVCGTLRKNRGVPPCLKDIKLKENGTEFRKKGSVLIQAFQTKKKIIIYDINHTSCKHG